MTTISKMKAFDDLTRDELKLVFEKNSKLREKIYDELNENANDSVDDYLSCWNDEAIDYMLGYIKGAYFVVRNTELFIEGLQKAQKDFGFLHCVYDKLIEEADRLIDDLEQTLGERQADEMEARLNQIIRELQHACFKRFLTEYEACFDYDYQLDYFLDIWAESFTHDDLYVDVDYILYEEVSYTKCYK